jgi:hypothetical protein
MDRSTFLGTGVLNGGQATFTTSILIVGQHSITAVYSGDSNFAAVTSTPVVQTVNKCDTAVTLRSSANPSVDGGTVTFTVAVSANPGSPAGFVMVSHSAIPAGTGSPTAGTNRKIYPQPVVFQALGSSTPTGIITFKDGSTILGTAILDSNSQAAFTISTLTVGSHPITAVYGGDNNFNGNTSDVLAETVTPGNVESESACRADTELLQPPDHRLALIHVTVNANQIINDASDFMLTSVTSSEPDDGLGDGDQSNDIQGWQVGTPDTEGYLRAERSGSGPGRTYSITYTVTKGTASGTCTATVSVPH